MPLKIEHVIDPVDTTVGAQIRYKRKIRKVSQQALADAVGVSFQQIQKYERGANRVSASMLVRIADALEADITEFFGRPGARATVDDQLAALLNQTGAVELLSTFSALPGDSRTALLGFMRTLRKTAQPV
jgi:transcriptional regulator with XRE-family HTH domain